MRIKVVRGSHGRQLSRTLPACRPALLRCDFDCETFIAKPGLRDPAMQDVTMLLFTLVFFGLAFLYVKACQKLR